jgi:hypothetical protein
MRLACVSLCAFAVCLVGGCTARGEASGGARTSTSLPADAGSAARDGGPSTTSETVRGVVILLEGRSGECVISAPGLAPAKRLQTGLGWPCRLNRNKDKAVRVFAVRGRPRFMLESSRPHPDRLGDCEVAVRGVEIGKTEIRLARAINRSVGCTSGPLDQMHFDFSVD